MAKKRRKRTNKDVPAKGRLKDMADKLWSRAVRDDWGGKCAMCRASNVEAHHIFPRQWEATRYDLRNGIALCPVHHKFDPERSPHMCSPGFCNWLERAFAHVYSWVQCTLELQGHKSFDGTKNPPYYMDVIWNLKQYVDEEEYVKIVGVKFAAYLENKIDTEGQSG